MPKPLPIGIQTFRKIVEGGYLYVDKTQYIYELIRQPSGVYFLSRPRRFGKSLLISTLAEIFAGNRELFQGLWLHDSPYRWEEHPVIRIDFSLYQVKSAAALERSIKTHLRRIAREYQVSLGEGDYHEQFAELILELAAQNQAVILIDEYDKPLIDNIENVAEARRIQEVLKGFYTVIKGMDAYIRFVFLTGISKFSRVGVFSGLNNLVDLSLSARFATALGLTQEEITAAFKEHITAFVQKEGITTDEFVQQMRHWYNGFCFAGGGQNVYNPFSTLLLFYHQRFSNYWFESGTPTFLIKLIKEYNYDIQQFDELILDELAFSVYEIENLAVVPLLFQTGYLTIKDYDPQNRLYRLYYPNYEVENAFLTYLLSAFSEIEQAFSSSHLWRLIDALQVGNLDAFFDTLKIFFAQIPYTIQLKDEKYYQTIFYLIFTLIGLRLDAEVTTNIGRIDVVIELESNVFIFEFKLDGSEQEALEQIKRSEYYQRYRQGQKTLHLIGVNFGIKQRGVTGWLVERLSHIQ
jgi:hypothetical protein